jgi:hypothetical protein
MLHRVKVSSVPGNIIVNSLSGSCNDTNKLCIAPRMISMFLRNMIRNFNLKGFRNGSFCL